MTKKPGETPLVLGRPPWNGTRNRPITVVANFQLKPCLLRSRCKVSPAGDCSMSTAHLEFSFIHSFILVISIAPLQVLYYSEALPTTARILYRSFTPKRTGNCR